MRRPGSGALALASLVLVAGCELGVDAPGAEVVVPVQLAVGENTDSTLLPVIAKVDRAWLEFSRDGVSLDTLVAVEVDGGVVRTRVALTPPSGAGALTVRAGLGNQVGVLFEGEGTIPRGATEAAGRIFMTPVPNDIRFLFPGTVDALGEEVHLDAAVRFRNGDRWDGWTLRFTALDPSMVELRADGVAVSRGNGQTTIVARYEGLTASQQFTVRQRVVLLAGVAPGDTTVTVGDTFSLRLLGEDPNGYPLVRGAGATWSSAGGVVVDSLGVARATVPGVATVSATAGSTVQTATITVVP